MTEAEHYALANALAEWHRIMREKLRINVKLATTRSHAAVAWRGHTIERYLETMGAI